MLDFLGLMPQGGDINKAQKLRTYLEIANVAAS